LPEILLWTGDEVSVGSVRRAPVAQVVRAAWAHTHGPPRTAAQVLDWSLVTHAELTSLVDRHGMRSS